MADETTRLALPLIAAGQAQKELFHNEALTRLDALVHGAVEEIGREVPPSEPDDGDAWILGHNPTGAWAGHGEAIAWWSGGGWRFASPREGMALWVRGAGCRALRTGAEWRLGEVLATALIIDGQAVVGPQQPAIAVPEGGATTDTEARAALAGILAALRAHGLIGH